MSVVDPGWIPLAGGRAGAGWISRVLSHPVGLAVWCVVASFGTYACMYGFRKPFTAAGFVSEPFGAGMKAWLVGAQLIGYTAAKFLGIRVIAEMTASRRIGVLLGLIAAAEVSWLLLGLAPRALGLLALFLNGLSLGMVFGLVLGFLEGRRLTETFMAGLCASFIVADGFSKSVGLWLLHHKIPEAWMPAVAGLLFAGPLVVFVEMLRRIPGPTALDLSVRSVRPPLTRADRIAFLRRHGVGLAFILGGYGAVTVLRTLRSDFFPELWKGLGGEGDAMQFTRSEAWVGLGILGIVGLMSFIRDNWMAFLVGLALSSLGLVVAGVAVLAWPVGGISPLGFMILFGLGMYLPYVAVHATVFERLIALTRDRGNLGFLMYVADALGYLGVIGVMSVRGRVLASGEVLPWFLRIAWVTALISALAFAVAAVWFLRRRNPGEGARLSDPV
jgi:Family of unknown function (DUF5690)